MSILIDLRVSDSGSFLKNFPPVAVLGGDDLKHILPVGWNNWGKKENEKTVFYAEYESRGEGANPKARAAFSQQLKNLQGYEITTVLAGEDGWNPVADGNKLITVKRWLDEYVKKWITKQKTMDI